MDKLINRKSLAQIWADSKNVRESNSVKILKFRNKSKVSEIAQQLLTEARENEPVITKDLKSIALSNNAKLVGLKDKFKSEHSLTRKLSDFIEVGEGISIENQAKQLDDALRYTMILSLNDYKKSYKNILSKLENNGFEIEKIWNAWEMTGKPRDTGYRGINVTIISSLNQRFELQFHTTDSFRVKTETHNLYEERRSIKTSQKRILELLEIGKENAKQITRPRGI